MPAHKRRLMALVMTVAMLGGCAAPQVATTTTAITVAPDGSIYVVQEHFAHDASGDRLASASWVLRCDPDGVSCRELPLPRPPQPVTESTDDGWMIAAIVFGAATFMGLILTL